MLQFADKCIETRGKISHFLLETDIFCYQICFKIATDT